MKSLQIKLTSLFFLSLFFRVNSQPIGRLITYTIPAAVNQQGVIGSIQYPGGTFSFIDSVIASDFILYGDTMYVAAEGVTCIYDLPGNVLVDSIIAPDVSYLATWNQQLISIHNTAPYFRVFDVNLNSMIYSIDSLKLSMRPYDIIVSDDIALLLLPDSVIVVDLVQQDTAFKFFTPHPLAFAGYNSHIVERGNKFYVHVAYITGAIRFSLIEIDKSNFNVTEAFHYEGAESIVRPVVAGDSIFMYFYNSHYSIPLDTFTVSVGQTYFPATFDSISHSIFLHNHLNNIIVYVNAGTVSAQTFLPGYLHKALFISDLSTGIENVETVPFYVGPNPATDILNIGFLKEEKIGQISLYDSKGIEVKRLSPQAVSRQFQFDLSDQSCGTYILSIMIGTRRYPVTIVIN